MNDEKKAATMCPLTSQGREQHTCFTRCAWWISEVEACAVTVMARNMVISTQMMNDDLFGGVLEIDEEAPF